MSDIENVETQPSVPKQKQQYRPLNHSQKLVRELLAILIWGYIITKLFIYDVDISSLGFLNFLKPAETATTNFQTLVTRGTDAINIGQYDEALNYYNQALVIAREVGDRAGEGYALANIGKVYEAKGQHDQALEYYNQSLVIAREVGDRAGEGGSLTCIGVMYAAKGQHDQALEYFNQALVITHIIGDRAGEGNNLAYIGKV